MSHLPEFSGVSYEWRGPKWMSVLGFELHTMMRIVAIDMTGTLTTRGGEVWTHPHGQSTRNSARRHTSSSFDDDDLGELVAQLQRLKKLERLYFFDTNITDEGIVHLTELRRLDFLNLQGTHMSDEALRALGKSMPQTTIVCDIVGLPVPFRLNHHQSGGRKYND